MQISKGAPVIQFIQVTTADHTVGHIGNILYGNVIEDEVVKQY